jgi:hypothetical protein
MDDGRRTWIETRHHIKEETMSEEMYDKLAQVVIVGEPEEAETLRA